MNSNPYVNRQQFLKALQAQIRYLLQTMPSPQGSPPGSLPMSPGEYTGKEVPLVPGSLRVYRDWLITPDGYLAALHWPQVWDKAEGNEARCAKVYLGQHASPHLRCTCGFYGKYLPEDMGLLHGVAELSGRIILGTKGARAQYAKPVAIRPRFMNSLLPLIQSNYPDLKLFQNNQDMYKAFPPQDVSELIPKPEPEPEPGRIVTRNMARNLIYLQYFKDAS